MLKVASTLYPNMLATITAADMVKLIAKMTDIGARAAIHGNPSARPKAFASDRTRVTVHKAETIGATFVIMGRNISLPRPIVKHKRAGWLHLTDGCSPLEGPHGAFY